MSFSASESRRGSPLAMLAILVGVWVSGRAVLWESPFPLEGFRLSSMASMIAKSETRTAPDLAELVMRAGEERVVAEPVIASAYPRQFFARSASAQPIFLTAVYDGEQSNALLTPMVAAGHGFLMSAAFAVDWEASPATASAQAVSPATARSWQHFNPAAPPLSLGSPAADRWSLDAFAFYRAGSGSAEISQGRVPVYGASQVAANLQYRIAPESQRDPRVYARAYRAFAADRENEGALGVSARPLGQVPVRVAAEVRVVDNQLGTDIRPAAYAVTELPVQTLPLGARFEAYGGAGYVGGDADTPFVDGQVAVTRQVIQYSGNKDQDVRLSLGAGAWGGAQEGASRLDIGPTLRVDLSVGEVPARISVDWRERVAGDAAPTSGIAATLSTRF